MLEYGTNTNTQDFLSSLVVSAVVLQIPLAPQPIRWGPQAFKEIKAIINKIIILIN